MTIQLEYKDKFEVAMENALKFELPNIKNLKVRVVKYPHYQITFDEGEYTAEEVNNKASEIKLWK